MDWTSGEVDSALTIVRDGILTIADGGPKTINGGVITNQGKTFWTSAEPITVTNGTFINNGYFSFEGAGNFTLPPPVGVGAQPSGITFENNGVVSRQENDLTSQFNGTFNNDGALIIESGRLTLTGAGFTSSGRVRVIDGVLRINAPGTSDGTFEVSQDGTLDFDTSDVAQQSMVLSADSSITGLGTVKFSYVSDWSVGDTTVNGTYNVATTIVEGDVTFNTDATSVYALLGPSGELDVQPGFTATKLFLWEGGTLGGVGTLTIPDTSQLLVNGAVTWQPGSDISNDGTFTISQGALITIPDEFGSVRLDNHRYLNILEDRAFDNPARDLIITNSGTITKEADLNTGMGQGTTVLPNVDLSNTGSGSIVVQNGTLLLQGTGSFQSNSGPLDVSVAEGGVLAFSGSFTLATATQFQGAGTVQVLGGTLDVSAGGSTISNFALLQGQLKGGAPSTIADVTVQNHFVWQGGDITANVAIPQGGSMFISRNTTTPLLLSGLIMNQGTAAWSGPVRIALPNVNFALAGGIRRPAVFSNPPNSVFDTQTIISAWNTLLDSVYKAGQSQTFSGSLAQLAGAEKDANSIYVQNVTSAANNNSLANLYVAAYTQAKQRYDNALQTAAQNDPTQSTAAYWDAVAQAEGDLDNSVTAAANQFVNAEATAHASYSGAGSAAYDQAIATALQSFQQRIAGAYVSAAPSVTVAQLQTMVQDATEIAPVLRNLPAESRASLFFQYWLSTGTFLPYSSALGTGSAPPLNTVNGNAATIVSQLNGWFGNVSTALGSVTPAGVLNAVSTVTLGASTFISQVEGLLQTDPQGLLNAIVNGISNSGVVIANTLTFGLIEPLNQQSQQIVQQGGFYRAIQVASVFVRELGVTWLTMGAGQLAVQLGTRAIGSIATGLGVSTATQTTILCTLSTAQRLMAPIQAYEQVSALTNNIGAVRAAINSGDYEGAAALLGRTLPTLPGTLNSLRDTARLAQAVSSLDPQTLSNYLQACFAAGTPILWEHGHKAVEQFKVGERVWARNEHNPEAPVELKAIEEVFVSTNSIWHVHVGGQVIRSTAEHPFWVQGEGWVPLKELRTGDLLVGHDGQVQEVEEVFDTGESETVYNFRVADHHTYFVGGEEWGFSVWAHNLCVRARTDSNWRARRQGSSQTNVYGIAQNTTTTPLDPHAGAVYRVANRIANNGTFVDPLAPSSRISFGLNRDSWITMNRSLRTALGGGPTSPTFGTAILAGGATFNTATFRPDEVIVEALPAGGFRVSMVEVASPGQRPIDLMNRMLAAWAAISFGTGVSVTKGGFIVTDLSGHIDMVR